MFSLVTQRLATGVLTLLAVSMIFYAAIEYLPGDFASIRLGPRAAEQDVEALRESSGLLRPLHVRYLDWLDDILHGDFGRTWGGGNEIAPILRSRLSKTLLLAGLAAVVSLPLGVALGILAAMRRNSRLDRSLSTGALAVLSIPEFVVGYFLALILAIKLDWLPSVAMVYFSDGIAETLYSMTLPVLTLVLVSAPGIMRMTRAALLGVLARPFVETATLKGIRRWRIFWHHVLPHAAGPVANICALTCANLIAGVVVVEFVFAYPGIGQMLIGAVQRQDVPLVQACGLVMTAAYIVLVLLADIVAIVSNPQLRQKHLAALSWHSATSATGVLAAVVVALLVTAEFAARTVEAQVVTPDTTRSAPFNRVALLRSKHVTLRDQLSQSPIANVLGMRVVDVEGQIHRLGVNRSTQPFVLVFLDSDCPVSARYAPELDAFAAMAVDAGAGFYGVVSNEWLTAEDARNYARAADFSFPVLWDASGELAGRLRPEVTPETFVVSQRDTLLYRGRIDDRFAAINQQRNRINFHDLRGALTSIEKDRPIREQQTRAVGCFFESWTNRNDRTVTYNRDIAPLVNANCAECHRAGGVAPFALTSFEDVQRRARMLAYVTEAGIMPPWPAAHGFGSFRDERHLSENQKSLFAQWATDGAPLGASANALPNPQWPSRDWVLGPPDLVVEMSESYPIPAAGADIYRYFVIPVDIVGDRDIVAAEFRPGDPRVVHHALAYIDYSGRARREDDKDDEYGFTVFGTGGFMDSGTGDSRYLYGWSPGLDPLSLPPGHGIELPGRSGDAVFEIHYRPNGTETSDRSRMGLYFAKKPVRQQVASFVAGTVDLNIAPEDSQYWRQVYTVLPTDISLLALSPHMHYIGAEVKAVASTPGGESIPLLHIPRWDFSWQNIYMPREPIPLPAGSRIDAWFRFDNRSSNPHNPHNPARRINWGWSSDQEMCELWMRFTVDDEDDLEAVIRAGNLSWRRAGTVQVPPP